MLKCSCCGNQLYYKDNVDNDTELCDAGYGICPVCGGDPNAKTLRAKMGTAATTFYDARIELLLGDTKAAFDAENKKVFRSWGYEKKCKYIAYLIKKGKMI